MSVPLRIFRVDFILYRNWMSFLGITLVLAMLFGIEEVL